jgi:predicted nucleotidyltransferase
VSHQHNITRIKAVHHALGELAPEVVFVGGAVVSLYADRPTSELRPTEDVDILVEVISYAKYAELEERLRGKGFVNDNESGIICRYKVQGIIVDVMPTEESIPGFPNIWYAGGLASARLISLDDKCSIRIFSPAHFLAAKLEAFKARGNKDGRTSTDFEDIVFLLNNRTTIWDELSAAPADLKQYLTAEFGSLLESPYLSEWISCHLDFYEQRRTSFIEGGIQSIAGV